MIKKQAEQKIVSVVCPECNKSIYAYRSSNSKVSSKDKLSIICMVSDDCPFETCRYHYKKIAR